MHPGYGNLQMEEARGHHWPHRSAWFGWTNLRIVEVLSLVLALKTSCIPVLASPYWQYCVQLTCTCAYQAAEIPQRVHTRCILMLCGTIVLHMDIPHPCYVNANTHCHRPANTTLQYAYLTGKQAHNDLYDIRKTYFAVFWDLWAYWLTHGIRWETCTFA